MRVAALFTTSAVDHRRANADTKAAVADIFKFDILFAPDEVKRARGCPSRLRFALLQLVDRPLRQADAQTKLALAPTEHGARQPDLGRKGMSLEPAQLPQTARLR